MFLFWRYGKYTKLQLGNFCKKATVMGSAHFFVTKKLHNRIAEIAIVVK